MTTAKQLSLQTSREEFQLCDALHEVWSQEPDCNESLKPNGDTKTAAQKIFPADYCMTVQADANNIECWKKKKEAPVSYTELTIGTLFEAVKCFIMRDATFGDDS